MNSSTSLIIFLILDSIFFLNMVTQNISLKNNNTINFGTYYFESSNLGDSVLLLVNTKPNVEVYCYNGNKWIKKEVMFYKNIIGYKAEIYDNDCLNKIKIVDKNGEIVYYKEFR